MAVVLATGGYDHKIRFWDATTGGCIRTLVFGESQVNCLQISPDKSLLAAGGNPHVQIFDINSSDDKPIASYDGHTNNVTAVGFHKNLTWLYSCSEDGTVRVWDPRSPTSTRVYESGAPVNTVVLAPNQAELISGDQSGSVKIWDLDSDRLRCEFCPLPDVAVRSISIAADASIFVVGSHKGKVFVYAAGDNNSWNVIQEFAAHEQYLLKCVLSPDYRTLATTSADKSVRVWTNAASSSSGNTGPGSTDANASSSGIVDFRLTRTLSQHQKWVWDAAFSADSSYLLSVSSDLSGKLWDLRSGNVIQNYSGHNLAVICVALHDSNP